MTSTESLEDRLARIKLKNKELEKKHRIAEEDRLDAMKIGALVGKTCIVSTEDDWPIEHRYEVEEDSDPEDQNAEGSEEKSISKFLQILSSIFSNFVPNYHLKFYFIFSSFIIW